MILVKFLKYVKVLLKSQKLPKNSIPFKKQELKVNKDENEQT